MTSAIESRKQDRIMSAVFGFEAECRRYVVDPLYGSIPISDVEYKVLQTDVFQRLKNIKQLGFISDLYPGANHTRFEHSVGTLHTTWEFFKRFLVNTISHGRWLGKLELDIFTPNLTLQALRLAGLLHDIGHGPYSHTFEGIFNESLKLRSFSHESLTLYMLSYGIDDKIVEDDDYILVGLKNIAKKTLDWTELQKSREKLANAIHDRRLRREVLMILNKNLVFQDFKPKNEFSQIRGFLNELIAGDIGSDRIDYLLRDTYFTGLGHRFNLIQVFDSVVGIFDEQENILRFAINAEMRNAIEFLLTTRYYHYRLIAHHLANLDREFRFKHTIRKDILIDPLKMLRLATLDEYKIQRYLQGFKNEYDRVFTSDLRNIKSKIFRFFFYRLASDPFLRKKYIATVKKRIFNKVRELDPSSKLGLNDIFIEIVLEKPHIPLLHVYRDKYRIEKQDSIEYHSILFHDWSEIVIALGRTYLLDSLFMVYVPIKFKSETLEALALSNKFYLSKTTFQNVLRNNIDENNMHRLDLLLLALCKATDRGTKPIIKIADLFQKVDGLQRKIGIYKYRMEKCYDAENKQSFDYCSMILNDLLVFIVSGAIGIDIKYMRSRFENNKPTWKAKYVITPSPYNIEKGKTCPTMLERLLKYYPSKIRSILGKPTN